MQLSTASISPEINSAIPAAANGPAGLASLPAVAGDGASASGGFAALFPDLGPEGSATAAAVKKKPAGLDFVSAPTATGSRRPGFDPSRPAARPADATDPLAVQMLAPIFLNQVEPTPTLPAMPDVSLLDAPPEEMNLPDLLAAADSGPDLPPGAPAIRTEAAGFPAAGPLSEKNTEEVPASPAIETEASVPTKSGAISLPQIRAPEAKARDHEAAAPVLAAVDHGEKIAEAGAPFERGKDSGNRGADKKILTVSGKQVTEPHSTLGTDVAKSEATMTASAFFRHAPAGSEPVLLAGVEASTDRFPPAAEPVAVASQAHRTVEAVLAAADRVGAGEQRAVNLQFSFSDVDLGVRVELREGAVHTTFRTDSTELRSALAHEWQAASSENADHPVRLAEPVFVAHGTTGFGSSAGDTTRQQRDPGTRPTMDFSVSAFRPASGSSEAAAPAAVGPVEIRRATTLHLQTFA